MKGERQIRVGILTISDSSARGERFDTAGPALAELVKATGAQISQQAIVPDERTEIAAKLREWADEEHLDVVLTTGGTGLSPRDVTPEATREVVERLAPGIAEMMREVGRRSTPLAAL